MNARMTLKELRRLLDVHGGDEARWPQEAREAARALCAADAEAAGLLSEARALDRLLEETAAPPVSDRLKAEILAAAAGEDAHAPRGGPARPLRAANDNHPFRWLAGGALAASLMLGVWLGLTGALSPLGEALSGGTELAAAGDALFGELLEESGAADNQGDLL